MPKQSRPVPVYYGNFMIRLLNIIKFCFLISLFLFTAKDKLFAEHLPLQVFTSADGMASSYVNYISRDSQGFLWFCTRDGLIRFDGTEFTNYQLRAEKTAQSLFFLKETSDGTYWIASGSGLYRLKHLETTETQPDNETKSGESRQILNAEKVSDIGFRTIYEDHEGRVWGGGDGLFLIRDTNEQIVLQKIPLGSVTETKRGINIRDILETEDGSFWMACYLGLMRKLPDGRVVYYPIHRDSDYDETFSLTEDTSGHILVGHATGLFILKPESPAELQNEPNFSFRSPNLIEKKVLSREGISFPEKSGEMLHLIFSETGRNKQANIYTLFWDSEGKLWFPANDSLYLLDNNQLQKITDDRNSMSPIGSLAEDMSGNLWIGTASGAVKYVREGFKTFDTGDGLPNAYIYSLFETRQGNIYAVLNDWMVARFDGGKFISTELKVPPSARKSWGTTLAMPDANGHWWASTIDGLYRFEHLDQPPSKIFKQADGFKSSSFFCSFKDSHDNLWFSNRRTGEENGVTRIDAVTGKIHAFSDEEAYPAGKSPISFAEDANGDLWFGFYEGGMARLRNGRFELFTTENDVPAGVIFALHFDREGKLWIASSSEGLSRVDDPSAEKLTFTHLTTEQGLGSNSIRSLTEDIQGNIYAGTIRGIDRINPQTGIIKHFSTADGLASDYVVAALRDRNGNLWFGTLNGISKFEPENDLPQAAPRVFISGLNIAGTRYNVSVFGQREIDNIRMAANENNLQINFSGIGDKESLHYQYKLEGANQDLHSTGTERTVNFANLAPGTYKFFVWAMDNHGQTSEQPASISFVIAPPFYRTWWFLTLVGLIIAGSVFALDRYRVKKTKQVKTALTLTKESETRFRTLTQTASDVIITIDEESTIIYVNDAVEKVFGYRVEELIGKKLTLLMPENLRPMHDAGLSRYLQINKKHIGWSAMELPGQHKSGAEIPLELSFGEFEQNGKHYFTGIARDISERRKSEAALQKAREERIAELQRVRSRIARDLHDDVGSSLTQVALYSEVAKQREKEKVSAHEPLQFLVNLSNELVESMSDIVWAINPSKDHLHDLSQRMRHFASEVLTAADINLKFDASETLEDISLGANLRREIFLIFKESINNIAKHSRATEAEIEFWLENKVLVLQIKDNGCGFDLDEAAANQEFDWQKAKGGNGLLSMRHRAKELGGEYEIISEIGHGTVATLSVSLEISH